MRRIVGGTFVSLDGLFGEDTPPGTLKLVEQRTTARGVLMATYEPAGPLKSGSIVTQQPSAQEMARREQIKAGTW